LDLHALVSGGHLFRPEKDPLRVEAFIPAAGKENHASNLLALPNGDLLCAWFSGSHEGMADVKIYLSRLDSDCNCWTIPAQVSEDSERSEQNPVLFLAPDGKIWLLYTAQKTKGMSRAEWERLSAAVNAPPGSFYRQETAIIRRRISADFGRTWRPVETFFDTPGAFCRQPMLVLSNGDWLFPIYLCAWDDRRPDGGGGNLHYSVMLLSRDQGQSWQAVNVPESEGRVQANVIEIASGVLLAFFRSRWADCIYLSRSQDYGRAWTVLEPTGLPNNNASIQCIRLVGGALAMVYNQVCANGEPGKVTWPWQRYPLTIAISEDEGRTWPYRRHLDTGDDYSGDANIRHNRACDYPALIQTEDGLLHVTYSNHGRQCIKYARFPVGWVRG
jgi:predicted neuraminidase